MPVSDVNLLIVGYEPSSAMSMYTGQLAHETVPATVAWGVAGPAEMLGMSDGLAVLRPPPPIDEPGTLLAGTVDEEGWPGPAVSPAAAVGATADGAGVAAPDVVAAGADDCAEIPQPANVSATA